MQMMGFPDGDATIRDSAVDADATEDWSVEPEVREILGLLASRTGAHSYLEVGAYRGETLLHVASRMLGGGHAYGIEPDEERASEIRKHIAATRSRDITLISATSQEAFAAWGREPLDLILVDGDHAFPQALFDISAWSTLLAPRGIMAIHDTITRLERRFPEDYFPTPWDFDILDVIGLRHRLSRHVWEGVALVRWREGVRTHVEHRFRKEVGW